MDQIILHDRYRLLQRIGIGGMAYVYEAEDTLLKRRVAVKVLKQQYVEDAEFLRKFENEAQSAAALNHPNIVNIYDVGEDQVNGQPLHYIVMELIEGTTLKDAIKAQGMMSSHVIARVGVQVARALQCAHDHGIVHRDIKPANILIMKSGDVKVADFGIARISSSATVTYTNSILGTVHYISPEQAKGHFTDHKSDLYSLGVVMYEMATGQVPFDADNAVGVAIKHIQQEPALPSRINPRIDQGLEAIILKCMEKDPADRPQDATELIEELENYRELNDTLLIKNPDWKEKEEKMKGKKYKEAVYKSQKREVRRDSPVKTKSKNGIRALILFLAIVLTAFLAFRFVIKRNLSQLDSQTTKVPQVTNISEEEAMKKLDDAFLAGEVTSRVYDDKLGSGQVIKQGIGQGTTVDKGTVIQLMISKGSKNALIPSTEGKTLEEATKALENEGFSAGQTTFEYSEEIEKDKVIGTKPASGVSASKDKRVNIIVSRGKKDSTTIVPVLLGSTQSQAIETLKQSHLELGSLRPMPSSYPAGTVIKQTIESGEHVAEGTVIDLIISSGSQASSDSVGNVTHNLHLVPPEGQDQFEVTIFDYKTSQDVPIFRKLYQKADVSSDGAIHDTVDAPKDADLKIFYDGKPAQTDTGTN